MSAEHIGDDGNAEAFIGWQAELANAETRAFLTKTTNLLAVAVSSKSRVASPYQHATRSVSGLPAYRMNLKPYRSETSFFAPSGENATGLQLDVPKGLIIGDFNSVLAVVATLKTKTQTWSYFMAEGKCVPLDGIRDVAIGVRFNDGLEDVYITGNIDPEARAIFDDSSRLDTVASLHRAVETFKVVQFPITDDTAA